MKPLALLLAVLIYSPCFGQRVLLDYTPRYASIVRVYCDECMGSAVIIDSRHAATAAHCTPVNRVQLSIGPANVIALHPRCDWALLRLEKPVSMGNVRIRTGVPIGEKVYGYGFGREGNRFGYAAGTYIGYCIQGGPVEPGDSGGPVLDSKGALVGLVNNVWVGTNNWQGIECGSKEFRKFLDLRLQTYDGVKVVN